MQTIVVRGPEIEPTLARFLQCRAAARAGVRTLIDLAVQGTAMTPRDIDVLATVAQVLAGTIPPVRACTAPR